MRPATTEADPLDDRPRGPCPECDGVGWRQVLPEYAERMYPMPQVTLTDPLDQAALEVLQGQCEERRAAARNTSYPCRRCRPNEFYRWANGHFGPDHEADRCPQCVATRRGKPAPPERDAPSPAARPDLD